jgi:hypothetical protein
MKMTKASVLTALVCANTPRINLREKYVREIHAIISVALKECPLPRDAVIAYWAGWLTHGFNFVPDRIPEAWRTARRRLINAGYAQH